MSIGCEGGERAANRLVYLKTLERGWPYPSKSRFACRAIANPFSRRPTALAPGTITPRAEVRNHVWLGFYRWRLKGVAGGSVYTEENGGTPLAVGALVRPDQLLWYQPNNNSQTNARNELSMAVEFEAVWTRAYVLYTGEESLQVSAEAGLVGGSPELNFVVYKYESSNVTQAVTPTVPVTYTSLFPNGSTDGTAPFTGTFDDAQARVGLQNVRLTHPFRIEYMKLVGGAYFHACGQRVDFGRGLQFDAADQGLLFWGLNRGSNVNGTFLGDNATFFRFETGRFTQMHLLGSNSDSDNTQIELSAIFGSDYDRARGDNSRLVINDQILGGRYRAFPCHNTDRNRKLMDVTFKSGTHNVHREVMTNQDRFGTRHSLYMGTERGTDLNGVKLGHRVLTIEGGYLADIIGGRNGYDANNLPDDGFPDLYVRIRGGFVKGFICGTAQHIVGGGDPMVVCTGGRLDGYIAAGANATRVSKNMSDGNLPQTGNTMGHSQVYAGGTFALTADIDTLLLSEAGSIYGSGCGFDYGDSAINAARSFGEVNNSTVVIADEVRIERDVYGGGRTGNVRTDGTATIYVAGGTVEGKLFGGGRQNKRPHGNVNIRMVSGTIVGGIYGGSYFSGSVAGNIDIHIEGGTVGHEGCTEDHGNVFGCGYGEATVVTGDVRVTIGHEDKKAVHSDNPLIHSNVYCGSYLGAHNCTGRTFRVKTWNGCIKRCVYGGGCGPTAVITGDTKVQIFGTTHIHGNVYGGGNMGKVKGNTRVQIGD